MMKPGLKKHKQGPVAQETIFGWVLSGCLKGTSNVPGHVGNNKFLHSNLSHQLLCFNDVSESTIKNFWDLDGIGITDINERSSDPIFERFKQTVEFKNGMYEVSLPWKKEFECEKILNNEYIARKRLKGLSAKLARDPELYVRYDYVLEELECSGVIEEVPDDEIVVSHPVFYLPHRPVIKESSQTTKIRPVFDASAKGYNGVSLNDCLETGPSLNPDIVEILLRFRRWPISVTADITKAFLQIAVQPKDRDVHRFFWNRCGDVRTMRFRRVIFGNCSSPFLLNATIKHHLAKYTPSVPIVELHDNLYVDDFLSGADSDEKACELFSEAQSVLRAGNFVLSQWNSNSKAVAEKFFEEFGSKQVSREVQKILGMKWLSSCDVFSFEGIEFPSKFVITKRVVLSFLAKLFDPLGFIAPFVMTVKILFQEIWRLGLQWDDELSTDLRMRFLSWVKGIEYLKAWKVSRCYFPGCAWKELNEVSLEVFCDSSERGYGACVYLRALNDSGSYQISLIISKARVAPIKKVTLPRLELLGALLGARLLGFVRRALRLSTETVYRCWSDSMIVLAWIRSKAYKYKVFVGNRISEIQELTDPACWFHVKSKSNPADLLTRGLSADNLVASKLWLQGPAWLADRAQISFGKVIPLVEPEMGELVSSDTETCMVSVTIVNDCVIPVEKWSSFGETLRVSALVIRFIENLKSGKAGSDKIIGPLSYHELNNAKWHLFKFIQQLYYPTEIHCLRSDRKLTKDSKIINLSPMLGEDGLLRVCGRLQMSNLTYEEKHPVILPKCHFSKLLIRHQHEFLKHAGVGTLVSSLRGSYWIVGVRRLAKTVKKECVFCQRIDARACNQPVAPLPGLRVNEAPPFTVTGLDYAGPLFCVDQPKRKMYILLFTCAVMRALHLEITDSMNVSDFMMAFRRFSSRRGIPSVIYSDNAKTFLAAKFELQKVLVQLSPNWKFIAPRAPWWGGFYERLVGSVKMCLKKSIGNRLLTRVELETCLCEVEAAVNSRPLTFLGDSVDSLTALTPSHFLIGRSAGFVPHLEIKSEVPIIHSGELQNRMTQRELRLAEFWLVWHKEYIRNLPPVVSKFSAKGKLGIGSVVLIREDNVKRLKWPLGRVIELHSGRDGKVRSVSLKTTKGVLIRPVQRLHNLEIADCPSGITSISDSLASSVGLDQSSITSTANENFDAVTRSPDEDPNVNEQDASVPVKVSRSGRIIKPVVRLNYLC